MNSLMCLELSLLRFLSQYIKVLHLLLVVHVLLVAYAHAQCAKAHSKRWLAAARGHSGPSDVKVLSALCAVAGLDCLITKNLRQTLPLWALLVTSDLNLGCTCLLLAT
jgi:hypothetical protein